MNSNRPTSQTIRSTLNRHLKKVESFNFEFPSLSLPLDSTRFATSRRSHQRTPSNESFSSAQTGSGFSGFEHSGSNSSNSAGSSYASHEARPLDSAGLQQHSGGLQQQQEKAIMAHASTVQVEECPACSESLLMRFGGEKTVTPRCGHRLHQECFIAVYGSVTRGKTLGVCGICRDNIIISDDGPSGGRNKFASLSGVPRADTIDSHKMRSVSHRTLELFDDDPTVVDLTQDDPLFIPTTLLSSIPLDRNASSSSSIGSQGRRTSSATARQSIASHGGALETDVRPVIKVQTEYSTVARSLEKDKKHHLTCMVTIEMPSRYPSAIISRRISPIITQDPKRNRPSTAESRSSGFYPRPSSPSGSTFSSYTYGSTTGHESIPPLPSNPFASVVEDLHRRMQDWKGHSPEFGALRIFDRLSIRKGDREHEFLIYLFEEAILCVTDDRAKGAPRGADEKTLRLKGRVYVRHIKEILDTSSGQFGDYSVTIKMNDEGLDSFVIVFKDSTSLNVWKSQIELLVERNRKGSPTAPPPAPSSGMGRSHTLSSSKSTDSIISDGSDASSRKSMHSAHFSNYTRTTSSSAPPFSPTIREEASIELRRFNSTSPRILSGFYPHKSTIAPPLPIAREFVPLDLMLILSIGPTTLQLNILKNTLEFLINNVGARTRISLVTYCAGDDGEGDLRRTPFIAIGTTEGKARLEGIVNRLGERGVVEGGMIVHPEESVNVVSAVNLALDVILQRKAKSALTGIVLLNDGKDGAHKQQMDLVMMRAEVAKVPMHAIGYGLNHEPASLWLLSNHTGGSYTFVREFYELRDVVAGIVGGMLSIAANSVMLHISVPEHRWFRIRKVSGINGAVVSSEGLDVDLAIGDLRLGERKELLVEMEMMMNEPLEKKSPVTPAFSSATDEYFLQKVGMNPMTLGEIDANFYEQEYEGMSTEVPLFEVNLAFQDPATNMHISRLNPSPTLLTVNVVPPANAPSQLVSDPAIIRRRMELLTSDMLTRTLTLMSRNGHTQAKRLLSETQRIISTISSLVADPSRSPRTSLSAAQSLAHLTLASCAEDVAVVLEGCTNREDFRPIAAFASQQSIVLLTQRSWSPRSRTEQLYFSSDNALYLLQKSQTFVSAR